MIYFTKKGDKGISEIGNKKFRKDSLIFEVLGELDELNSLIGLSKNYLPKKFNKDLTSIQNDLFIIQANVAWFMYPKFEKPKIDELKIKNLELKIEKIEKKIKPSHRFIIYGSDKDSAWFDFLRAKTRTVERRIVKLNRYRKIDKNILVYINRLSSYFYALARFVCYNKRIKEKEPWY